MILLRALARLALIYAGVLILGFLAYIGLIRTPLLAGVEILFYRGVLVAAILALLLIMAGIGAHRWLRLAYNISFLIVFPVTFDRSITMFLLARIERQDGQLDATALERLYIRQYLGDMRQIDRRIAEQAQSGNIEVRNGHIRITPQGRRLLQGARVVGDWFDADPRFVTAPAPLQDGH